MSRVPFGTGRKASGVLIVFAIALVVWTVVSGHGPFNSSSSHLASLRDRAERETSATSSGSSPKIQGMRNLSDIVEYVIVEAEAAQMPLEGDGGRGLGLGRVYRWEAWGKAWAVQLWEDTGFMAPTLLLRYENAHEARVVPPTHNARCFYTGVVLGAPRGSSAVAVNVCKGLSGVIRVGNVVYLIEPASSDLGGQRTKGSKSDYSDPLDSERGDGEDEVYDFDDMLEMEDEDTWTEEVDYPLFDGGPILHIFTRTDIVLGGGMGGIGLRPSTPTHQQRPNVSSLFSADQLVDSTAHDTFREPTVIQHCDAKDVSYIDKLQDTTSWETTHHRTRRFLYSRRYSIEVMVVVDSKMARYHGKHVNQYVLTLMSVVALIFRDPSIGNRIDIAVVEIVRPDRQSFTPKRIYGNSAEISGISAEEMLKMFCKWQKQGLKYNTNHPRRYDTALLLTRENICRNPSTQSCDTLGLAELGTMCSKHSSCAIVQDNGLSAAFTIAHELGHLLNMPHDNDDKCSLLGVGEDSNQRMNVMSRMLDHNTLPWVWSNCSRHYLTEYLHGGHGRCLEDEPWTNKLIEEKTEFTLAGEMFNSSKQCQYVFGKSSKICPYMPTCKRLWCTTSLDEKEGCRTQHMPWADGTKCDTGKWCLRGKCVQKNKNSMKKMDGKWGDWGAWSTCSRTCGVGVRRSERKCDSPPPKYGGRFCIGERVKYESCIMRPCSTGSIDFRTQQCQAYNSKNFGLPDIPDDVKWVPKYAGIRREDSCKLFCQVYNSSRTYFQLREKVEDGTPCGPETYDICVNGICRIAGCDYVLNSTAKADNCGVCNGDNSTCEVISELVNSSQGYGYSDITVIPEGAARIDITQRAYHDRPTDDNYLALVDMETGEYLLNGHWIVTPFQKLVEFGGTMLEYTGSNAGTERINSTKPLQKKLLVQLLSVGDLNPPNIHYSFTKSTLYSNPNYYWRLGEWSNCSEPCVGKRQRTAYCVRADSGAEARDELCPSHQKPAPLQESCAHTCPVHWSYSDWSKCQLDGESCVRRREVRGCVSSLGSSVENERCATDQKYTHMDCPREECPSWQYSDWSPCSCKEGDTEGLQQRLYACQLRNRSLQEWECDPLDSPVHARNCSCWYAEQWMPGCELNGQDGGDLTVGDHRDSDVTRLEEEEFDSWTVGGVGGGEITRREMSSGAATPKCGVGVKRRQIHCGSPDRSLPMSNCDPFTKPSDTAPCNVPCPTTSTTTTTTTTQRPTTPTTTTSITAITTSSTLTRIPPFISSSRLDDTPSVIKGGRQHGRKISLMPDYGTHMGIGGPWRQPHYPERPGSSSWTAGVDRRQQHTNDIPNTLPSSLDERERLNRDDIIDNRLDTRRHRDGYSAGRSKGSPHHSQHQSSEEEINNEVQDYGPEITSSLHPTNWKTGGWTACSRECGGGEKRRQVVCYRSKELCRPEEKPVDRMACNTHRCAEWSTGDWGHCRIRRRRCGRGKQERLVVCRDPNGPELEHHHCHAADKPTHNRKCKIACSKRRRGRRQRYKWKSGEWSPCSEPCDRGVAYRNITCIDTGMNLGHSVGTVVHIEYCLRQGLVKPRGRRGCNKHPCPHRWVAALWSECSSACGNGVESREVSCHAVNSHHWVDPEPISRGCSGRKKPKETRKCNLGDCPNGYYWKIKPWKKCQGSCGEKGRQRRNISCVDRNGRRVRRSRCDRDKRPKRKQKCKNLPCGSNTCDQVREPHRVYVDGEYSLLIGGRNMSIFCYGMNSSSPREYLTLPAGEEGNFAEFYNKILIQPEICPQVGERLPDCDCEVDQTGRSGYTTFSKIRINVTSLQVDTSDFTFARSLEGGTLIPYGEAGDCFSTAECPQGAFSINLAGTSLAVSPRTNWVRKGNNAVHWINRLDDNQRILGRCGGYCGTCAPDPSIGLKLHLRDG